LLSHVGSVLLSVVTQTLLYISCVHASSSLSSGDADEDCQ
jgi:hypothetical protein